jgi:hypothetical protein
MVVWIKHHSSQKLLGFARYEGSINMIGSNLIAAGRTDQGNQVDNHRS